MKNMSKQKGFTILELIVVIAIMAAVSGALWPIFSSMKPKFRLNGAARMVQGDLMWARMQAINQNNRFRIYYFGNCTVPFNDNHHYQILDDDDNGNDIDIGETLMTKDIQTDYLDVTGTSNANPIFYPRGNAFGATITLTNSSGSKQVIVSPSGRIRVN